MSAARQRLPFRLTPLAAAALLAAGCGTTGNTPSTATAQAAQSRYASQTLADLESVEVEVQQGSIEESASIEGALESYKQAVQLFNDPEKRVESLRRMADLALDPGTVGEPLRETARRLEDDIRREHSYVKHVYIDVHALRAAAPRTT